MSICVLVLLHDLLVWLGGFEHSYIYLVLTIGVASMLLAESVTRIFTRLLNLRLTLTRGGGQATLGFVLCFFFPAMYVRMSNIQPHVGHMMLAICMSILQFVLQSHL